MFENFLAEQQGWGAFRIQFALRVTRFSKPLRSFSETSALVFANHCGRFLKRVQSFLETKGIFSGQDVLQVESRMLIPP